MARVRSGVSAASAVVTRRVPALGTRNRRKTSSSQAKVKSKSAKKTKSGSTAKAKSRLAANSKSQQKTKSTKATAKTKQGDRVAGKRAASKKEASPRARHHASQAFESPVETAEPIRKRRGSRKRLAVCAEVTCESSVAADGINYCRLHYMKNWRTIKHTEAKQAGKQLADYITELSKRYPDDYVERIREALEASEETSDDFSYDDDSGSSSGDSSNRSDYSPGVDSDDDIDNILKNISLDDSE